MRHQQSMGRTGPEVWGSLIEEYPRKRINPRTLGCWREGEFTLDHRGGALNPPTVRKDGDIGPDLSGQNEQQQENARG